MRRFFAAAFFLLLAPMAFAGNAGKDVKVGLYLLDVSKYDITSGEFTADFYLGFYCDNNCSPENFEFMNGRATTIDKVVDKPDEKFYRIQGTFVSPVDMEKYPFDSQTIQIILEDKLKTTDELRYAVRENESTIDSSMKVPGWEMTGAGAVVDEHYYKPYDETYSRYTFSVGMERARLHAFLKTFVPLFFIVIITLASLMLSPSEMGFRISIAGSALITTVLLHLSILSEIPPTPYLTFTDKFMFVTYAVVLSSFLVNILMLELDGRGRKKDVEKLQGLTERAVLLVPLVYILLFYLLLS
jgi:uncharacterized protein YdeI (BOF family)